MAISLKEVPIEAHNSIGKVKQYYASLQCAYEILYAEDPLSSPEASLQMAIKVINNMAGLNGIIPTLLVFSTYPQVAEDSTPIPTLRQHALAIQKTTKAIC